VHPFGTADQKPPAESTTKRPKPPAKSTIDPQETTRQVHQFSRSISHSQNLIVFMENHRVQTAAGSVIDPRSPPRSPARPRADGADALAACGRRRVASVRGPHSRSFAREPPHPHQGLTTRTSPISAGRARGLAGFAIRSCVPHTARPRRDQPQSGCASGRMAGAHSSPPAYSATPLRRRNRQEKPAADTGRLDAFTHRLRSRRGTRGPVTTHHPSATPPLDP
jgi:hypothetical protein